MKKKLIVFITLFFMFILNVDAMQSVWDITLSGNSDNYINSFLDTKDGYVIVGSINDDESAAIEKFNKNRNLIWKSNYGGNGDDWFNCITSVSDGYVVLGSTNSTDISGITNKGNTDALIIKYDLNGNVVWQKNYGGEYDDYFDDIISVSDGYVVIGTSYQDDSYNNSLGVIVKFDLNGNIVWEKKYGGSGEDYFNSVISISGGYIVVGGTTSTDIEGLTSKGANDAIVLKYDLSGNIVWQKNYGGSGADYFNSVISISGGYIVVGGTTSTDINGITTNAIASGIIVKYDLNGTILSQKSYTSLGKNGFNSIIKTTSGYSVLSQNGIIEYDNNLSITNEIPNDINDFYINYGRDIIKKDNGYLVISDRNFKKSNISSLSYVRNDLLWQKNYGELYYDTFNDVTAVDNGYLAVGMYRNVPVDSSSTNNINNNVKTAYNEIGASLVKYDLDGNIIFQRRLDGNGDDVYTSVSNSSDGIIAVGTSISTNIPGITNKGRNDGIIVKYDINGSVIWQKNYGGSKHDYFNSIEAVSDGYIVAGYTYSTDITGIENTDGFEIGIIIKFDLNGNVVWQKKSQIDSENIYYDVKSLTDGYIVVGEYAVDVGINSQSNCSAIKNNVESYNITYGRGIIIKYDLSGNVVWQKTYTNSNYSTFYSVTADSDGYVAVGDKDTNDNNVLIVKYDSTGNIIWEKYIENYGTYSSVDTTTDGYIVAGRYNLYPISPNTNKNIFASNSYYKNTSIKNIVALDLSQYPSIIDKYDKNGNLLWSKFYGGSGYNAFNSVIYSSGNYIAVGTSSTIDMVGLKADTKNDAIIVKYKSGFDVVTIANDDGSIASVEDALEGEKVTVTITPNKGYTLKILIVKDKDGNIIKVNEDNTFIMPAGDVTVEAIFTSSLRNPETWDLSGFKSLFLYLITIAGSIGLAFMIYISKKSIKL